MRRIPTLFIAILKRLAAAPAFDAIPADLSRLAALAAGTLQMPAPAEPERTSRNFQAAAMHKRPCHL
jgi:hypothetical protein